jgi:hypothetical protein
MADKPRTSSSPHDASTGWVRTELESVEIGDKRLNARLVRVLEKFWQQPQASIPKAMGTWADTKAAYRLLKNPKLTAEKVLGPHRATVRSRLTEHPVVLAVQDTTQLNFTAHPATEGLGTIGSAPHLRGMHVHTTVAFSPERVPLGLIQQQTWIRPDEELGKGGKRRKKPIEEKESFKWLDSLQAVERLRQDLGDVELISVGDREADIYDLFKQAAAMKTQVIVRASWDRRVQHEEDYLWAHVETQPAVEVFDMLVPVKKSKKVRTATLELRFVPVTICAPKHRRDTEDPIPLHAVYVNEPHPPEGVAPLSWMLLTTIRVASAEEAMTIVAYYTARWGIEVFHRILKSGCRIEERQLESAEGLRKCLALDSLVAWRIQYLTMLGREAPDLPCDVVFEDYEWKALYCFVHRTTQPPASPPRLGEAIKLVARVGGFLARKGDGAPGPTVLWRGLQELATISFAWFAFGPEHSPP